MARVVAVVGMHKRMSKFLVRIVSERRMPPSDQFPATRLPPVRGLRTATVSRYLVGVITGRVHEFVKHVGETIVEAGDCELRSVHSEHPRIGPAAFQQARPFPQKL